jgi:GNAT superfamily N-acetyltransferase
MPSEPTDPLAVGPVAATELPDVLRLLFCRLDPQTRSSQIATVLADIDEASGRNQILLAARRRGKVVAAVWMQIRAGRVASLYPPGLASSESEQTVVDLIDLATQQAGVAGVRLVQTLLEPDAKTEARWLVGCGFQHAADLLYLVCPSKAFPPVKSTNRLQFEPLDEFGVAGARLAKIVERTYQGSQDCPAAHGIQPVGDLLASYRSTGPFDPTRWMIVRNGTADMGCLLLAEHPISSVFPISQTEFPASQWELLYMGVIPEQRGQGWGLELVQHAQWLAGQNGAQQLALAVDAANAPAIAVYSAAEFQNCARRSVFLKKLQK